MTSKPKDKFYALIEKDGTVVTISDQVGLQGVGPIRVKRASRVAFSTRGQKWSVTLRNGVSLGKFITRVEGLAKEVVYINDRIKKGFAPGL